MSFNLILFGGQLGSKAIRLRHDVGMKFPRHKVFFVNNLCIVGRWLSQDEEEEGYQREAAQQEVKCTVHAIAIDAGLFRQK